MKNNCKTILCVTLGGTEIPSANYRIRQYYSNFRQDGWAVTEFNLKTLQKYDFPNRFKSHAILNLLGYSKIYQKRRLELLKNHIQTGELIWINKLIPKEILPLFHQKQGKVVLDVDDAIWINNEDLFLQNLQLADAVLCGNRYIEEQVRQRSDVPTYVVPTSITIPQDLAAPQEGKFIIGWLGSSFTNEYLLHIQKPIQDFLAAHADAELHIVSADMDMLRNNFVNQTKLIPWTEDNAEKLLSSMSIGIMPMPNDEWVKGKCSFKMIQYMSYGKASVVSPYGMNAEILNECNCGLSAKTMDEWLTSLELLYQDEKLRREFGQNGYNYSRAKFDKNSNFELISDFFCKIVCQ